MRIAAVVQRYGEDVIGGAETQARLIAERLHADLGCQVDVLTTTALSHVTWARVLAPGAEHGVTGVRIIRFNPAFRRAPWFHDIDRLTSAVHAGMLVRRWLRPAVRVLETAWLLSQGPVTPDLVRYLRQNSRLYDKVIFFTYLYYPTIWGVREVPEKAILVPEAHDELPFHFNRVSELLARVPLILVNTEAERDLVIGRAPHKAGAVRLAGLGVDMPATPGSRVRDDPPFLLCSGRLSRAKGVDRLLDYMAVLNRTPGLERVRLILTGTLERDIAIPASPLVEFRGAVPDEERRDLLCRATALVNLSEKESLSLVVLDAMAMRTPVIVNGLSPVLRRYAEESDTVAAVSDGMDFCRAVRQFAATDWSTPAAAAALDAAREWVSTRYGWPRVLAVYREALGLATPPAQPGGGRSL